LRGLRIAKIPTSAAARQPAGQAEGSISDYRRSETADISNDADQTEP